MNSPEVRIPHPRQPPENPSGTPQFVIHTLGEMYTLRRGGTPMAAKIAFAALNFGRPFTRADLYRRINPQRTNPKSRAGEGPRSAIEFYEAHGFMVPTEVAGAHRGNKYLKIGAPLVAFAEGYNIWHVQLIEWCLGRNRMPAEKICERARQSYAMGHGLSPEGTTYESLAQQTRRHPLSVQHLALEGWTAAQEGLSEGIRTIRDQWIAREVQEGDQLKLLRKHASV